MTLKPVVWNPGSKLISLALVGGVALSAAGAAHPTPTQASPMRTWLTINRPSLCRIWVTGSTLTRHCTTKWYLDKRGNLISGDPTWVPVPPVADPLDVALAWPHYRPRPAPVRPTVKVTVRLPPKRSAAKAPAPAKVVISGAPAGHYSLWTPPPGHPAYRLADFAGDPNAAYYGTCTWYAQYRRRDERLMNLGNAWQWAFNAPSHGLRTGSAPAVGATVIFQPGVFGAGSGGHAGHVEAVLGGGWFLISEMNMAWNGGGFGRVSYRYAVTAPGVSFIY